YPRLYALEVKKTVDVASKLSQENLTWSFRRAPRSGSIYSNSMDKTGANQDNFRKVCRWWEVDFMEVHTFDEWVSWIVNLQIPIKHKRRIRGKGVVVPRLGAKLWHKIEPWRTTPCYDVQPIPEYFTYFSSRLDATGRKSIGPILKCTSAIRQLAYGTAPDAFDEYLQIAERTSRECLDNFTKCIHVLYNHKFLRRPSATDIEKTYKLHEEKHGLPGMLGSIDCMHWDWKNCPKSLHGQFKRRDHKYPTLMLEAVADQRLWIWHAYFGVPGANNDLNVLYGSPLFDDEIADIAPECPFIVNGHTYRKCYYLADGIYPEWSTFVKTFSVTRDAKTFKFKTVQEAARKDIERAFGVLQGRWGIIRQPARAMQINNLKRIMYCCIILHNMILENEGFEVNLNHMFVSPEPNMVRSWVERCDLHVRKAKELRDRKTHVDLRQDLVEHLWNNQ
ncbi:ALP1-like protein isoform X1, partial [Tanacetum coccineum]